MKKVLVFSVVPSFLPNALRSYRPCKAPMSPSHPQTPRAFPPRFPPWYPYRVRHVSTGRRTPMNGNCWRWCAWALLLALLGMCGARAEDVKPTDEGKAEDFKGKTFDLKEKGEAAIMLTFPGRRRATVTV